jgi:hypothetical protein
MASQALTSIRQNLQSLGGTPAAQPGPNLAPSALATPGGQTEQLRRAAVASTGKAETGLAAPVQSELERTAVAAEAVKTQDAQAQATRTAEQVTRAATQLEKDTLDGLDQLTEQQASQVQQYRQKAVSILDSLNRNRQQLSFAKQKSAVEQAGFLSRLSNKKYVDELHTAGKRQRLDEMSNFKNAVLESTFKDMEDLMQSDLAFRRAMGADAREFAKYMATMDLDTALAVATGQLQSQASAGQYSGLSAAVGAGTRAYQQGAFSSTPAPQGEVTMQNSSFTETDLPSDVGE